MLSANRRLSILAQLRDCTEEERAELMGDLERESRPRYYKKGKGPSLDYSTGPLLDFIVTAKIVRITQPHYIGEQAIDRICQVCALAGTTFEEAEQQAQEQGLEFTRDILGQRWHKAAHWVGMDKGRAVNAVVVETLYLDNSAAVIKILAALGKQAYARD